MLLFRHSKTGRTDAHKRPAPTAGLLVCVNITLAYPLGKQFCQRPNVISQARFHRRGDAERLMDAAEVVIAEPQRHGCRVILKFGSGRKRTGFQIEPLPKLR
jgi:hypothetical protein